MQLDPAATRQVSASLLRLRQRAPFLALLSMFTRVEATAYVPTAATDGRTVYLNQEFFGRLEPAEQDGLLLHEVLHAALLHIPRLGQRERLRWNVAADIVINGMIAQTRGFELPEGGLREPGLEHLCVEEVYELIRIVPGPGFLIDLLDGPPPDASGPPPESPGALEAYWRQAQQQARMLHQSAGRGNLPAGWARELGRLDAGQLDWRSYLWRFVVQTPTDFSDYDRRFVGQRMYLETMAGESVRVYVGVDTSGSIGRDQLGAFMSEVLGILRAYPHLIGSLYYVDAAAHGPFPLEEGVESQRPVGGGGTDFRPFFAAVAEEHAGADEGVCVYLTDGFGDFPDAPPDLPVLWVVTPGGLEAEKFPFGEVARLLSQ
ncbi:MAG TPA: VWA-like domain-containing protein [Herpetosiphonaceae bacterium]|nr:VWA-like domain-containing protein [Herpetosiphonaceae bacterium]